MGYDLCSGDFKLMMNKFTGVVHPHLALVLCSFGSVSNVLCIVVLSKKRMVSPTSTILVGLAVADLLVLVSYLCFAILQEMYGDKAEYGLKGISKSYSVTVYQIANIVCNRGMHGVSIWLTVTLAVWRYLVVCWPNRSKEWCNQRRAKWTVVSTYICVTLVHIPICFMYEVDYRGSYYEVNFRRSMVNVTTGGFDMSILVNYFILGVLVKLVPCILLTLLTLRLVWELFQAKKIRKFLMDSRNRSVHGDIEVDRRMDRTTRMVVVVLFVFLVTEFPGGIVTLLVVIWGHNYFYSCYLYFSRLLDTIVLLNSSVNFLLYCSMSNDFRRTFKDTFVPEGVCRNKCFTCPMKESNKRNCAGHNQK